MSATGATTAPDGPVLVMPPASGGGPAAGLSPPSPPPAGAAAVAVPPGASAAEGAENGELAEDGSLNQPPPAPKKVKRDAKYFIKLLRTHLFPALRKGEVSFLDLGPVELFFWGLTLVSLIVAAMNDADDPQGKNSYSVGVRITDLVLSVIFLIEMALRGAFDSHRSVLLGEDAGYKRPLRALDGGFLIANVVLHALFFLDILDLKLSFLVLRSPRILRPLFTITTQPTLRLFVVAITRAMLRAKDVIVLYIFFLLWVSVSAVYQFGGLLRARCVNDVFFSNDTNVQLFITTNNLTVTDFVCGSGFLEYHEVFSTLPLYDNFINTSALDPLTMHRTVSCSLAATCVPTESEYLSGFKCPYNFRCAEVENTYHGFVGFDNLAQSFMSLFISLTFQLWYEAMFWIADAGDVLAYVYFHMLMLVGGFMIANVTVVILTIEYEKAKNKERQNIVNQLRGISAEDAALQLVKNELTDALAAIRGKPLAKDGNADKDKDDDDAAGGGGKKKGKKKKHRRKSKKRKGDAEDAAELAAAASGPADFSKWDGNWDAQLKKSESEAVVSDPTGAAALLLEEEARLAESDLDEDEEAELEAERLRLLQEEANKKPPTRIERIRQFTHDRIVKMPLFGILGNLVILANFAIIAYDHYGMDKDTKRVFDDMNLGFTIYFTVEMIIRFIAHHPIAYFKKAFNILDVIIVVGAWVDIAVSGIDLPAIRALRVLRVLKLLKNFPKLYDWLLLIVNAAKASPMLVVVLALLLFTFACVCMALFGGRFCGMEMDDTIHISINPTSSQLYSRLTGGADLYSVAQRLNVTRNLPAYLLPNASIPLPGEGSACDGLPHANFDDFGTAMVTAFQIMTGDDWEFVMYNAMRVRGVFVAILFVFFFFGSNLFVLNLVVAILLNANQKEDTDFSGGEDLDAKIRRLEAKEEEEERKKREMEEEEKRKAEENKDDEDDEDESDDSLESEDDTLGARRSKTVRTKSGKVKNKSWAARAVDFAFVAWAASQRGAKKIVSHPATPVVMALVIIFGSVCQGLEDPLSAPDETMARVLWTIDIVVTVIYCVELALNVHAYGLIEKSTSYLQRDKWNIFDMFLVIISLVGIIVADLRDNPVVRALKVLRALRPLRLIKRSPGMRLVLSSLMSAAPQMTNVGIVAILVFVIFGVVGVQFFGGRLRSCFIDGEPHTYLDEDVCVRLGGQFINDMAVNFDSLPASFVALFVVATLESWATIMHRVMDSRAPGLAPQRNASWGASFFFVFFAFFVGLFLVNFFVSVLIDAYNREKRRGSVRRSLMVTREQEAWLLTTRRIAKHLPIDDKNIDEDSDDLMDIIRRENYELRKRTRELVRGKRFKNFMLAVIFANFVILSFYYYPPNEQIERLIDMSNIAFTLLFVLEALLKIYGETWRMYIATAWNRTDFFIAFASLISIILDAASVFDPRSLALIRTLRVIRLVRFIRRWIDMDQMIRMMGKALIALGPVLAFIFLIFFIFAVLGMNLFGRVHMGVFGATTGIDRHSNFFRLDHAIITLLRITLGGNWGDIMASCQVEAPFCEDRLGECGAVTPIPQLYFVVFLFVSMFMLRNLFIAVMLDSFNSSGDERGISKEQAMLFYENWKQFDEDNEMVIAPFDTLHMLRQIPSASPLGFNARSRRHRVSLELQFLIGLKLLNTNDPVPMAVFVDELCRRAFDCPMPEGGTFVQAVSGDKSFLGSKIFSKVQDSVVGFAKESQQLSKKLIDKTREATAGVAKKLQTHAAHLTGIQLDQKGRDAEADALEHEQRLLEEAEAAAEAERQEELERQRLAELQMVYTEMASLIMINGIIRRRKDLIREQLMMQEKIAQRRFNSIGIMKARQALRIQKEGQQTGDPAAGVGVMSTLVAPTQPTATTSAAPPAAPPVVMTSAGGEHQQQRSLPPAADGSAPPPPTATVSGASPARKGVDGGAAPLAAAASTGDSAAVATGVAGPRAAETAASLPLRDAVGQSRAAKKPKPGKRVEVQGPTVAYIRVPFHFFPAEANVTDVAEERAGNAVGVLLRHYLNAGRSMGGPLPPPVTSVSGVPRRVAPVFFEAVRLSVACTADSLEAATSSSSAAEADLLGAGHNASGDLTAMLSAPLPTAFVRVAEPTEIARVRGTIAEAVAVGKLVALASHISAAAATAVRSIAAAMREPGGLAARAGVDPISASLPVALLPSQRERLDPETIRSLRLAVEGEVHFIRLKIQEQTKAINDAVELCLMRDWLKSQFPHDEIPDSKDIGELRRWGQGPPNLLGAGAGPVSGLLTAVSHNSGSRSASRVPSREGSEDDEHETSAPRGPASVAPSYIDRGSELADTPELLHCRADEDPLSGFQQGFFDRLELVYGVIGALEQNNAANLSCPFPLATALPLIDAVIDHVGGFTIEWDRHLQAYLHEGAAPLQAMPSAASPAGGQQQDGEPEPALVRTRTSKALKSGGAAAVAAAAAIKPLPLQLNFESQYVADLLRFVQEGVLNADHGAAGEATAAAGPASAGSPLTGETLRLLNRSLNRTPKSGPAASPAAPPRAPLTGSFAASAADTASTAGGDGDEAATSPSAAPQAGNDAATVAEGGSSSSAAPPGSPTGTTSRGWKLLSKSVAFASMAGRARTSSEMTDASSPSGTTLLKFKIQMAAHVDRAKERRLDQRKKWGAMAAPKDTGKVSILQAFGSTSGAAAAAAAAPPPAQSLLATDSGFAPIMRRCRNFRNTFLRYVQSVRKAVMLAVLQLENVAENRRTWLEENNKLLEKKLGYASRIADVVSFVDEASSWMPPALAAAVRLEEDEWEAASPMSTQHRASNHTPSKTAVSVLSHRLETHITEALLSPDQRTTAVRDMTIVSRVADGAARMARMCLTAARRRALIDSSRSSYDLMDEFAQEDGSGGEGGLMLLTRPFAAAAIERLEGFIATAVNAPRTRYRTPGKDGGGSSFAVTPTRALGAGDSFADPLFGQRVVSEVFSPQSPGTNDERAAALSGVLTALRGTELRDRIGVLRSHGVSVYVVRRWEAFNSAGATTAQDSLTCLQLRPAGSTRHTIKLNTTADAFEFWKPGGRTPIARLALTEIASVDRDGGPQFEVPDGDGIGLGRLVRFTLGRLTDGQQDRPQFASPVNRPSTSSARAAGGGSSSAYKLNNRFELVPNPHYHGSAFDREDDAAAADRTFRVTGESGHFSPKAFYSRARSTREMALGDADDADGEEMLSRDGEDASRTVDGGGFASSSEAAAAGGVSFGLRAVMSTDSYTLSTERIVDPSRGAGASALRRPHAEEVVFVLPAALGYSEWLLLLRDTVRFAPLVPMILSNFTETNVAPLTAGGAEGSTSRLSKGDPYSPPFAGGGGRVAGSVRSAAGFDGTGGKSPAAAPRLGSAAGLRFLSSDDEEGANSADEGEELLLGQRAGTTR